jgi:hypothetical protein
MLYIATSSGYFPISGNCLPDELSHFANKNGVLTCSGSLLFYRTGVRNIANTVDDKMKQHTNSIILVYASANHYALLLGREARWRIE